MKNAVQNIETLGWNVNFLGEIDHRTVQPPYVRLIEFKRGKLGDYVCFYDLRFAQPNQENIDTIVLHTLEHCLIAGFRKHLSDQFISVGPMGCQTGFYLVLLDMLPAEEVINTLEKSLEDILLFDDVPYRSVKDCGQMKHHDLTATQEFVKKLLQKKKTWLQIEND